MCIAQLVEQWPFKPMSLVQIQVHPYILFFNKMKHNKQIFPKYFYSCLDETKCVRLINLSSKENRYAFNFNCKIYYNSQPIYKDFQQNSFKNLLINKDFINQYFK